MGRFQPPHFFYEISSFFLPFLSLAAEPDQGWLRLLRYQKSILGTSSQVQNSEFFLTEKGKNNVEEEWNQTLLLFSKVDRAEYICRFPARYLYLFDIGLTQSFDLNTCQEFKVFKDRLPLAKASLVFSSYFIDRPASAFGHSFLKLDTDDSLQKGSLVSYGVDYAAQVTTNNPFLYGIFGITGGFDGKFNLLPYFFKVREYNDYESRDLYEYELYLNENEKHFLVAHLYEMNFAQFDYYYFTQNCSYHVLAFLEAVLQEDFLSELKFFVIPIDTVKPLINKGRVSSVNRRMSLREKFLSRMNDLTAESKKKVYEVYNTKSLGTEGLLATELDALIDYIDLKHSQEILLEKEGAYSKLKEQVLLFRSSLKVNSAQAPKKDFEARPDQGHGSNQFKLNLGRETEEKKNYAHFRYKLALHEYLDPSRGFNQNSTLNMGDFSFRLYEKESSFKFMNATLAEVLSVRDFEWQEKNLSWHFSFGAKRRQFFSPYLDIGLGFSKEFPLGFVTLLFKDQNSFHRKNEESKFRINLGPEILTHLRLGESLSFSTSVYIFKNLTNLYERDYEFIQKINWNGNQLFQFGVEFVQSESTKDLSLFAKTYF